MSETQASEARLRLALRAARQGAWEYDLRTGRGVRSPELMHLMNVHNDQPSLADFLSNVAPEDRPLVLATFQKLRCGEQDDSVLQFRYVRDDGGVIWVEQHTFVERGADGEALRLYGVTRDVTEHKRIEAELQALNATLEERVRERSRALEERTAALDAFVAFTERVGSEWGARELARGAVDVLRATLGDVSVAYYERQGDCWRAVVWSEDIPEDALAMIRAGVPVTQPRFHEASLGAGAYFMQDWDAEREHLDDSRMYGAGALYPYFTDGEPAAMLNIATMRASSWSVRERAIFSAVGRSLALALERGEQTRRTKRQNAELDARTRALEGFADLSRDLALEQDPVTLVGRAQDIVVSLLPSSICTFYELDAALWTLRSHRGEFRNPDLLAAFLRGLPRGRTPNVDRPFDTGEPYYQDRYDPATTAPAGQAVTVIRTSAAFPVRQAGRTRGVLVVGLHEGRAWTSVDRALLETILRNLELALDRAQGVAELATRTRELERSNAELEQFAHVASHDLQAPIRAVTSFAAAVERRYGDALDERGRAYLGQIVENGQHMKRLVDDLLTFSRVSTEKRPPGRVDASAVFDAVAARLAGLDVPGQVTRSDLPSVLVDAQQLDQLLQNLVSNGLKYARPGVPPRVHVSAEPDGRMWRFSVRDEGIGIEEKYFERIFVIFQRLHTREQYEGTGVGLAVCRKIVERHGGRLWVESVPGEGATFHFTLPGA